MGNYKKITGENNLPTFLQACIFDFERFYFKNHSGQKLLWCFGLSKIDIQYLCFKNKNICITTLPQYLALLHLEKYNTLTITKITK